VQRSRETIWYSPRSLERPDVSVYSLGGRKKVEGSLKVRGERYSSGVLSLEEGRDLPYSVEEG